MLKNLLITLRCAGRVRDGRSGSGCTFIQLVAMRFPLGGTSRGLPGGYANRAGGFGYREPSRRVWLRPLLLSGWHYYPFFGYPYDYYGFGYPFYGGYGYGPGYGGYPDGQGAYDGRAVEGGQRRPTGFRMRRCPRQCNGSWPSAATTRATVDGQFGPASKDALTRFQRETGPQGNGPYRRADPRSARGFTDHR